MGAAGVAKDRKAKEAPNHKQLSKEVLSLELPPEIPRNCIYFIFILRSATDQYFGPGVYPLDIINSIVLINAYMGEFKGLCHRCYQWHNNETELPNVYHSGKWAGKLNYDDFLNRGFTIDLFYKGQFGTYLRQTGSRAGSNFVNDTKNSYSKIFKGGCTLYSKSTDVSMAVWDKGTIVLGLPCMMVTSLVSPFVALGIWTAGLAISPLIGMGHMIATPFIDGARVIASDLNPEYILKEGVVDGWSCCRRDGIWAKPCKKCDSYCDSENGPTQKLDKKRIKLHLEDPMPGTVTNNNNSSYSTTSYTQSYSQTQTQTETELSSSDDDSRSTI